MPAGTGRPFTKAERANQAYKTALDTYGVDSPEANAAREKAISIPQRNPADSRTKVRPVKPGPPPDEWTKYNK